MGQIINAMREFLAGQGWSFEEVSETGLRGQIAGKNARWTWFSLAPDDDFCLTFCSTAPVLVPLSRRRAVAEFITRANYGMRIGCIEMDLGDGEVNFKVGCPVDPDQGVTNTLLERVVFGNFILFEKYLPGLLAVAFGNKSPESAVAGCEKKPAAGKAKKAPGKPNRLRQRGLLGNDN